MTINTETKIEEMVNHTYKGLNCKIFHDKIFHDNGFGVLFRLANKTIKTDYGCWKCITDILEKSFTNDSDTNKHIQDLINYLKPLHKR